MRPEEEQGSWEPAPVPVWDREGVWRRIAERRVRRRRLRLRRRLAVAAGGLLIVAAAGVGVFSLTSAPRPTGPDEILPMMKDRVLDDSIAPDGDTLLPPAFAAPPPFLTD